MNKIPVRKLRDTATAYFPIAVPETVILNQDIHVKGNVGGYTAGMTIPAETTLQKVLEDLLSGSNGGSTKIKVDGNTIVQDEDGTISVATTKDKTFYKINNSSDLVFKVLKYIGGRFYAGNNSGLYYSTDAKYWNKLVFDKTISVNTIVQNNGIIHFGGKSGNVSVIGYSTDNGNTFKLCDLSAIESSISNINRIEFEPDREVWVASDHSSHDSKFYYYSWNGIDWFSSYIHTDSNSSIQYTLCSIRCLNHKWYAHGWTDSYVTSFVTEDPSKTWKQIDSLLIETGTDQPHIHSFAYSNGSYLTGYLNLGKGIYYSRNGINWIHSDSATSGATANVVSNGLYCYNTKWFALDSEKGVLYSTDQGKSWYIGHYSDNSQLSVATIDINKKLWYHGGIGFVILETGVAYSTDGETWVHKDLNGSVIYDIEYVNGAWFFATSDGIYASIIKNTNPINIDGDLDEESTNPVENRALTKRIKELCTINNVAEILDTRSMPAITTNGYWKVYDHDGNLVRTVNTTSLSIEQGYKAVWSGEYYYDNSDTVRKRVDFTQVANVDVEPIRVNDYNYGSETTDALDKDTPVVSIKNKLADKISIESVASKFKSTSSAKVTFTNYFNITRRSLYCDINSYTSNYLRMDEGNPEVVSKPMPMDFGWAYNTNKTSMAIWTPSSWGLKYMYRYMLHEKFNGSIYMWYPSNSNVSAVSNLCRKYRNIVTGQFKMFPYPEYSDTSINSGDDYYVLHSYNYYKKILKYNDNGTIKYLIDYKVSSDPYTMYRSDNDDLLIRCKDNETDKEVFIKPQYKMNVSTSATGADTVVYIDGKAFQVNKSGCLIMDAEGFQIQSGSNFDKSTNSINRNSGANDIDYILDNYSKVAFMDTHSDYDSDKIIWNKSDYPTIENSNVKIFTRTITDQRTNITSSHVCVTDGSKEFDITVGGLRIELTNSNGGKTNIAWVTTKDIIALNQNDQWFIRRQNFNIKLQSGTYLNNGHDKGYMTNDSRIVNGTVTYSTGYDTTKYTWLDNDIFYVEIDPELIGVIDENTTSKFYHYIGGYGHIIAKVIPINQNDRNGMAYKTCAMSTPSGQWLSYDVYVVDTPRFTPINERIYYANEETKLTTRYYPEAKPEGKPLDGEIFSLDTLDGEYDATAAALNALHLDFQIESDDDLFGAMQLIADTLNLSYFIEDEDTLVYALAEALEFLGAEVIL